MRTAKRVMMFSIVIALAYSIIFAGSVSKAASKAIEWKMQCIYPTFDTSYTIQATGLAKRLNEGTKGRLHVTLYPPGALVPEGQMFDALSKGVFDAALHSASVSKGRVPEADMVLGMPLSFQNNSQFIEFFYQYGVLDLVREAYAKHNLFFLMPFGSGEFALMTTYPLDSIADIKGKKLWISGSFTAMLRSLGATPISLPFGELYMAMKLGTIDGITWTVNELESSKFKEVVRTVMLPYLLSPPGCEVLVNMDAWKALPNDLKQTVESIAKEFAPIAADAISVEAAKAAVLAKEHGVEFREISDADQKELREAARREAWVKFAEKSDRCRNLEQLLENYLKEKGVLVR